MNVDDLNPFSERPKATFSVQPIHLAIGPADIIVLDRRSGIGRTAHELEMMMLNLGRASYAVEKAHKAVYGDPKAKPQKPPIDNRVWGGTIPATWPLIEAKAHYASIALARFRKRVRRAG